MARKKITPIAEDIVIELLKDLVPEGGGIGTNRGAVEHEYITLAELEEAGPLKSNDYILVHREGGFLYYDRVTDIVNLTISVFTKDERRSQELMIKITDRMVESVEEDVLGFPYDFCEILSGPELQTTWTMDDRVVEKVFQIHIRPKWED